MDTADSRVVAPPVRPNAGLPAQVPHLRSAAQRSKHGRLSRLTRGGSSASHAFGGSSSSSAAGAPHHSAPHCRRVPLQLLNAFAAGCPHLELDVFVGHRLHIEANGCVENRGRAVGLLAAVNKRSRQLPGEGTARLLVWQRRAGWLAAAGNDMHQRMCATATAAAAVKAAAAGDKQGGTHWGWSAPPPPRVAGLRAAEREGSSSVKAGHSRAQPVPAGPGGCP